MRVRFSFDELRVFCAVCDAGTLSRGAEQVALSMSAVSAKMKSLEEALGATLFERSNRGIALTATGSRLLNHAREVLEKIQFIADDMYGYELGATRHIKIATTSAGFSEFLVPRLAAFLQRHPDVDLALVEQRHADVMRQIAEGRVDIGICKPFEAEPSLAAINVAYGSLMMIVGARHPWAKHANMWFAHTLGAHYISLPATDALHEELRERAAQAGKALQCRVQVSNFDAASQLVARGVGVAIVPAHVARRLEKVAQVASVGLLDEWAHQSFCLCMRAEKQKDANLRGLIHALAAQPVDKIAPIHAEAEARGRVAVTAPELHRLPRLNMSARRNGTVLAA